MSYTTIIKNAIIVTMDEDKGVIMDGNIQIKDGAIVEVWENKSDTNNYNKQLKQTQEQKEATIIDGKNLIIMPGLINTHGHAAMTLFRGYADDIPLMQWLEEKIWPVEAHLTNDDIYWGTMLAIVEMLKSGTTTFTDMYFCMEEVARAVAESGIRGVLSRGLIGITGDPDQALKNSRDLWQNWHGAEDGRINIMLGPHAPYTCPPDFLKSIMALADKTELPMQIHISETRVEVENCLKEYRKSPVKHLDEIGLFEYRVIGAHCVHLDDDDIKIISDKGVGVAHNPVSNLKLGSGIAPVEKMLDTGINVGIGTDGAASNNNLDMFKEMQLSAILHKGKLENPLIIPAEKALKMATCMGAKALFLNDVGMLKEGYKADLIGINRNLPHLCPLHNVIAHLVYSASGRDVEMVMVDGKLVMEEGRLINIDEEKILNEAERCAKRLIGTN